MTGSRTSRARNPMCKRVMEAHGGSVSVESTDHQGASFVLTFPKAARSRGAEQEPKTPESV
jgi:K+-sensing histidine kinase KdpD